MRPTAKLIVRKSCDSEDARVVDGAGSFGDTGGIGNSALILLVSGASESGGFEPGEGPRCD